ncbi:MAG: GFA family protein, partial [Dyella sp.]|nr:GFA family protein [Dyella sp.]
MQHGSCHCGRITFDVEGEPAGVMECNCTHCSRKGFLLWFVPREQFHLHAA